VENRSSIWFPPFCIGNDDRAPVISGDGISARCMYTTIFPHGRVALLGTQLSQESSSERVISNVLGSPGALSIRARHNKFAPTHGGAYRRGTKTSRLPSASTSPVAHLWRMLGTEVSYRLSAVVFIPWGRSGGGESWPDVAKSQVSRPVAHPVDVSGGNRLAAVEDTSRSARPGSSGLRMEPGSRHSPSAPSVHGHDGVGPPYRGL